MATAKKTQAAKKAAVKKADAEQNPVASFDNVEKLTPQADGAFRQGAGLPRE